MTLYIEHSIPPDSYLLAPGNPGFLRDAKVINGMTGKRDTLTFWDDNKRTASGTLALPDTTNAERLLELFFQQVRSQYLNEHPGQFWLLEDESRVHSPKLRCGAGDGSRTTFVVPLVGGSAMTFFDARTPQESGVTFHQIANLGTNNQATLSGGNTTGWIPLVGGATETLSIESGFALDGIYCLKVTPGAGAEANHTAMWDNDSAYVPVTAGEVYTGTAHVLAESDSEEYVARIAFYQSDGTFISTVTGTAVTATNKGTWYGLTFSTPATAPALAARAVLLVQRNTSSSTIFWVDGCAINPGDLKSVYYPAQSPGAVEFTAAPTSGNVIECSGTGQLTTLVAFDKQRDRYRVDGAAIPLADRFATTEVWRDV
jgi:hypothetical protein